MTLASILAKLGIIASSSDLNLQHASQELRVVVEKARRVGGSLANGDDHERLCERRLDAIDEAFRRVKRHD